MRKKCISVTSHALYPPPPVTNCHTFSDPLPLERDVLYGRPLTALCNSSIREASLPDSQKRSILLAVIKQEGLDQSDPANYMPIANVTFLSKILERIVANQLISYLDASNQCGFRRNHSTETLLLRLLSDFYSAMDRG